MKIERLGELRTALGECPVWHGGRLWLMDCRAGLILALDPSTGEVLTRLQVPAPAGCFAFHGEGGLVVALKDEIVLLDPADGSLRSLAVVGVGHPDVRLNDGCAMPDGSFVVGTMHVPREAGEVPLGGVYRLDDALQLQRIAPGLGVCNGPGVNPADGRFYVADSAARMVYSYAVERDGSLSDRRVFVDTEGLASGPDGCCFDTQGGLWTALVRVGALARFDLDGRLTARVDLPVAHPASLCFGGAGMDTVFVTSISDSGRLRASGALDGGVLKVSGLGFRGATRWVCRVGG